MLISGINYEIEHYKLPKTNASTYYKGSLFL